MASFDNIDNLSMLGIWFKDFKLYQKQADTTPGLDHTLNDVLYGRLSRLARHMLLDPQIQKKIEALKPFKDIPVKHLPAHANALIKNIESVFKQTLLGLGEKPSDVSQVSSQNSFFSKLRTIETVLHDPRNGGTSKHALSPSTIREYNESFQTFVDRESILKEGRGILPLMPHAHLLTPDTSNLASDVDAPQDFQICPRAFYHDYIATPRAQVFQHAFPSAIIRCKTAEDGKHLIELTQDFVLRIAPGASEHQVVTLTKGLLFSLSQHTGNMVIAPYMDHMAFLSKKFLEQEGLLFETKLSQASYSISPVYHSPGVIIPNAFKITFYAEVDSRYKLTWSNPALLAAEINRIRDSFGIGSAVKGVISGSYEVHMNAEEKFSVQHLSCKYETLLT